MSDHEKIRCWSCDAFVSLDERSEADGDCPHCNSEIDLGEYLRQAMKKVQSLLCRIDELKAGQGGAVAVVAYLPTEEDLGIKYSSKAGPVTWFGDPPRGEHLMTVAQHVRIVAAITAPPATSVIVPRELLERIIRRGMRLPDETQHLHLEELRALLAQSQELKS